MGFGISSHFPSEEYPSIILVSMFIDPNALGGSVAGLDRLEEIERASLRLVTQAVVEFSQEARITFSTETDLPADIAEDATRDGLEQMGVSGGRIRVSGKVDYKRSRLILEPDYAIRQALLVDSKAEDGAPNIARVQVSQTSMRIRQIRADQEINVQGMIPPVITRNNLPYLTTTIIVKYCYTPTLGGGSNLTLIKVACIPNGMLQARYNPTAEDTIWLAGPDAPTRGEAFRTRLSFPRLSAKAAWRVQNIPLDPAAPFVWNQ